MKKKLTNNLGLKILAVLFSVVIWFIVVNINDPVDKTVFRNVPVEILNAEAVTNQGKVYEILDDTDVIDVTVWAKRSILDALGKENVIATADMQEINFMDTMVRIKLSTNKYNDKLENITSPTENMLISIEDMRRGQFLITTVATGEPAEGYILGNVNSDQNLVVISGPESLVGQVKRAEVSVDVTGLSQDVRTDASIRLFDAENNLIGDKNLKKSLDQVKVNVEILQTKRVPLVFACMGVPADGYAMTGEIESSPSTVLLAGKGNAIKNLSQIEIPDTALNVTGQSSNMTTMVDLKKYLPESVRFAEDGYSGRASVTVHIEKEDITEVLLPTEKIVLAELPEGMQGDIEASSEDLEVHVSGLVAALEALKDMEMTGTVNVADYMEKNGLRELPEGEYTMEVELNLPENIRQTTVHLLNVTVRKEKGSEEAE